MSNLNWKRSNEGNTETHCGLYHIGAEYHGTNRPQGYTLWHNSTKLGSHDTQAQAKEDAAYHHEHGEIKQYAPMPAHLLDVEAYNKSLKDKVVGSPEQVNFWSELVDGTSHLILEARAGSGKTFSCIEGAKKHVDMHGEGFSIIMVAYNKSIASELEAKVPAGVEACTMHSLGFRAVRDALGGKVKVDNWKTINLLEEMIGKDEVKKLGPTFQSSFKKVVSLAKNTLMDWLHPLRSEFDDMVRHFGLQLNGDEENIWKYLQRVLEASRNTTNTIDFDDMIWLPLVRGWDLPEYDLVFVDEAQDLNKSRQELATRCLSYDGRLVIVGDPKQAIYGFTGADAYSMKNMEDRLSETKLGCKKLPLTVSRRCPKSHVAAAQKIVSDIKAMPDAKEGSIESTRLEKCLPEMKGGDLVLCRMNAPLLRLAYMLIKQDTPVTIQGRDIGTSLANLVKQIAKKDMRTRHFPYWNPEMAITIFQTNLDRHYLNEVSRLEKKAQNTRVNPSQFEMLQDRNNCIEAVMQGLRTVGELVDRLKNLFSDCDKTGQPKEKVLLSSVHRAKGLEAETVFILEPEKMPHPMAQLEWEVSQEYNIKYVALTRSLDKLTFVMEGEL